MFNLALGAHIKRITMLESNVQKAYSLVLGQCTDLITTKIESSNKWENIKNTQDVLLLLQEIKSICYNIEDHKYKPLGLHLAKANFYSFRQGIMTNSEYYTKFKNIVSTITSMGGTLYDSGTCDMFAQSTYGKAYDV